MKKMYSFNFDCGRQGELDGIFVADEKLIDYLRGKEIYFGEVLGKHSEIYGPLDEDDLKILTDDQEFIGKFVEILGGGTLSGYNPIDYYNQDGEDEEWEKLVNDIDK